MTLQHTFWYFPTTKGIDIVRLYISTPYGVFTKEFNFDCRKSWGDNFKDANLSNQFLDETSNVVDFEFIIESESIVLEIQVREVNTCENLF